MTMHEYQSKAKGGVGACFINSHQLELGRTRCSLVKASTWKTDDRSSLVSGGHVTPQEIRVHGLYPLVFAIRARDLAGL